MDRLKQLFFILLLLHLLMNGSARVSKPTVIMDKAKVIGQTVKFKNTPVKEYLGIPYAEPPLGDLRFQPPNPLSAYEGTIEANKQPPACPQETTNPYPWYYNGTEKSEDCLYLNIWTPSDASPSNSKAVIYWIHGGGFRSGSIRMDLYDGKAMSAVSDVIVVTVNYRLGPFGFLYSGTTDAPGNAGLWDIAVGLQWVNSYIEAFGGDRFRITIAGESAGSIAVGLLNVSPLTYQLFQSMIMESAAPLVILNDGATNLVLGDQLAALVSCGNKTFTMTAHGKEVTECLKALDFKEIMKADSQILPYFPADFSPIFGDKLIPEDPKVFYSRKDLDCKKLLIGVNNDEGSAFISSSHPEVFGFFGEKDSKLNRSQAEAYILETATPHNPTMAEAAVEYYLPADLAEEGDVFRSQVCDSFADYNIVCAVEELARQCSRNGDVYFYYWRPRPSTSPWAEWEGATHFSEVEFVFGQPAMHPEKYQRKEVKLSYRMMKTWGAFAKNGSPGDFWPQYSVSNRQAVYLQTRNRNVVVTGEAPHLENCKFVGKALGFQ